MNKCVVVVIALFTIISVGAMEWLVITDKENDNFSIRLAAETYFAKRKVKAEVITKYNSMYLILHKISDDFIKFDRNLSQMITSQGLSNRIKQYTIVDSDPVIKAVKAQLGHEVNNNIAGRKCLKNARNFFSGILLEQNQPAYFRALTGKFRIPDKTNFLVRNAKYPLTEDAIKDYTALFIYQNLLASRVS